MNKVKVCVNVLGSCDSHPLVDALYDELGELLWGLFDTLCWGLNHEMCKN